VFHSISLQVLLQAASSSMFTLTVNNDITSIPLLLTLSPQSSYPSEQQ
jgi:hypothetical protein